MPRSMRWFRSNGGKIAWLAFFALACQFVFTFGHVHFANVSAIPAALASSAHAVNNSADAPTSPARQTPAGLAQDFCAVCNNISLANTLVLPVSPALIPPISTIRNLQWSLAAIEFTSPEHFHFNARGPPELDLPA
jgi:hypothetical protein